MDEEATGHLVAVDSPQPGGSLSTAAETSPSIASTSSIEPYSFSSLSLVVQGSLSPPAQLIQALALSPSCPSYSSIPRQLSVDDINDNFNLTISMTPAMVDLVEPKVREEFSFEWFMKDWRSSVTLLDKKKDLCSPTYNANEHQWRLKIRKDKVTKNFGLFLEMLGPSSRGAAHSQPGSRKMKTHGSGQSVLFAATFALGLANPYNPTDSLMEPSRKTVIFRPGEYQWGWTKFASREHIEKMFVKKNALAVRAIIRVL